jgi:hypothetical protein
VQVKEERQDGTTRKWKDGKKRRHEKTAKGIARRRGKTVQEIKTVRPTVQKIKKAKQDGTKNQDGEKIPHDKAGQGIQRQSSKPRRYKKARRRGKVSPTRQVKASQGNAARQDGTRNQDGEADGTKNQEGEARRYKKSRWRENTARQGRARHPKAKQQTKTVQQSKTARQGVTDKAG